MTDLKSVGSRLWCGEIDRERESDRQRGWGVKENNMKIKVVSASE